MVPLSLLTKSQLYSTLKLSDVHASLCTYIQSNTYCTVYKVTSSILPSSRLHKGSRECQLLKLQYNYSLLPERAVAEIAHTFVYKDVQHQKV